VSLSPVRRSDRVMDHATAEGLLARARFVTLATVDSDGQPYAVPNLFVYETGMLHVHTSAVEGHFRRNIAAETRVSFSVCEIGEVYPYGEFACDTSIGYASVVGFGRATIETGEAEKARFFDRFMAKYADPAWQRPRGFYPRLAQVTVYRIAIETLTGKAGPMPGTDQQWPAINRTLSPGATPT
jgi:nitroimidazol reductase NimA-like FMN-containing flavoprotein (pyridoxamine 5'-phosphate oxidase superfamily)